VLKALHTYLTNDTELKTLVGYTPRNQRIKAYVPKNKTDYPYVIFELHPSLAGNPVNEYRCKITTLSKNVLELESIAKRVMDLLHFRNKPGFQIDESTIYHSKHVGSEGINYDPDQQLFEQILTFNIKGN
jgi:hypothetical protein